MTLTAPAPGTGPPRPRLRLRACVAAAALVAVLGGAVVSSPVVAQDTGGASGAEVRIVARKLDSGRIEFGLQQRQADNTWGDRQLPRVRFFPTTATVGRWLASSPLDLTAGEVRIVARKLESGRVEFGLQQRQRDDTWSDRQLPRVRFFPTTATVNRWLASSLLTLIAPQADPRYTAVAAGGEHTCGLHSDGTITCWGNNLWGQADAPAGQFSAVSAGGRHSCGLRTNETVECWGKNTDRYGHYVGQADAPAGHFSAVSASGSTFDAHTCGLRTEGTIECWGWNEDGKADPPAGQFSAVAAAFDHSCGLRIDGTIACWGWQGYGHLEPPAGQFSAVSTGGGHSCGLRPDGTIECWGWNSDGQADPPAAQFSAVSTGGGHSCGLRPDGTIECWGWNEDGQTDAPSGAFAAVSAGGGHSCGLDSDGTIECWGSNEYGQLDAPPARFADPSRLRPQGSQPQESAPDGPMELPGRPRNVRIDYAEGYRLVIQWQPPETGGQVDYYFVDARLPGEFFPPVHPRSMRGSHSFRSQVINRNPDRSVAHGGREDYSFVIDYVALDPDTDRRPADEKLGHGAVRVVAVNRDGLAVSDEILVPSERSKMHRALRALVEDMVSEYGDAVPWLDEVWDYITEREQSTDPRYDHRRSKIFAFLDDWLDLGPYGTRPGYAGSWAECDEDILTCGAGHTIAVAGSRNYQRDGDLNAIRDLVLVTAHELGHIHTLSNHAPSNPLAIVAGYLYLDNLLRSDPSWSPTSPTLGPNSCVPHELYADLAMLLVREQMFASDPTLHQADAARGLGYWSACTPGGSARPSQEAIAIARSALSGQIPQWFYDTYQNPDGSYDLDTLWRHVKLQTLGLNTRYFVLYALRDQFGGYCPDALAQIKTGALYSLDSLDTGNPWREDGCPQPTPPPGRFSAVSTGGLHSCAIRVDGTIQCWGPSTDGQTDPPPGQFAALATSSPVCAIRSDGTIECWGTSIGGEVDAPDGTFSAISIGRGWCGIRTDGTLECRGHRQGDWVTLPPDGPGERFTAVSFGSRHSCAVRVDGTITCWGFNQSGNLDAPSGQFTAVSAASFFSCGLRTDNTIECWGSPSGGKTDPPPGTFITVSAGPTHACGLRTDMTITCWGRNDKGQTDTPAGQFAAVSAGGAHTCALRTDGTIACWGDNSYGQLGLQS